jgi:hypothetical protein
VSGGARLTSGTLTLDVEIGHPLEQPRMTGGGFTLEGAAAVKRKPGPRPTKAAPTIENKTTYEEGIR